MNLDDLIEALRCSDVYNLDDVAYAIIETNGKLCVIKKSQVETATREDLGIKTEPASLPVSIIMDGRLMKENIALTKRVVDTCKFVDVQVEGELGHVGDNEGSAEGSDHLADPSAFFTDPALAKDFVDKTGVDALAIAVVNPPVKT